MKGRIERKNQFCDQSEIFKSTAAIYTTIADYSDKAYNRGENELRVNARVNARVKARVECIALSWVVNFEDPLRTTKRLDKLKLLLVLTCSP